MRFLFLFLLGTGFMGAAEPCRYSATLKLPDTINSTSLHEVKAELTIRWICEKPLLVRAWSKEGPLSPYISRDTIQEFPTIFSESGEKVECLTPLADYWPYETVRRLVGDQQLTLELKIPGTAKFKNSGRYYAVIEIYAGLENGDLVRLESDKCWFAFIQEIKPAEKNGTNNSGAEL